MPGAMPLQRVLLSLIALLLPTVTTGCATSKRAEPTTPTQPVLRVTHHLGGTHYRTIVHDDRWYQTFSNQLLVINPRSGRVIRTVELSAFGTTGPAVDMAVAGGDLFIVLRDDAVVQLSIENEDDPVVVQRVTADMLGSQPRALSVVNTNGAEAVYVCGEGGAVRFPGGAVALRDHGAVTSVARAAAGLVGTADRRVYTLDGGEYLGSASTLQPIPDREDGMMIFTREGSAGVLIGLMEPDVRERSASKSTTAIGGHVHRVRWFDGSMWIVADEQILAYTPTADGLEIRDVIKVKGARDVDMLRENYLAVAGTFGRAVYRVETDDSGRGDTFIGAHREPSRLSVAVSDRMQILAGSPAEGMWIYQIGSEAKLTDRVMTQDVPRSQRAVIDEGTAVISEDGATLVLDSGDEQLRWSPGHDSTVQCVIAVEGRLWVGHDRGLAVLEFDAPTEAQIKQARKEDRPVPKPALTELGRVRLDGPVRYLFALLTGRGAAYVAEFGGFGTVEVLEEPIVAESDA